ncbi:hypothetical protein GCM10009808_21690 [Microbacterium sediminicola]|uniref:Uncharacterized protein n=1 Tax=Microbacterium sediminicola TaxID=415210 RepID=A0ABN2IEY5_9MICO
MAVILLIPAYEPGSALIDLVVEIREREPGVTVLVVDDGSGPAYDAVFEAVAAHGARVESYAVNAGKGAALKHGLSICATEYSGEDVVTADSDGQHTPADIGLVAARLVTDGEEGRHDLILGARQFVGDVPRRSQVGNAVARSIYWAATGWRLRDTQTGLRGIPSGLVDWMQQVPGRRFDFEQTVLLRARRDGVGVAEVPIATVYLEGNRSSHFRPVIDSLRVLLPVLLFLGSSLLGFVVDTILLFVFVALTNSLWASIVLARVGSAAVNFTVNRSVVFRAERGNLLRQLTGYGALAIALLAANIVWMTGLTTLGVPLLAAKVITEIVLFVTSYGIQRTVVFARRVEGGSVFGHRNHIAADRELVNTR